MTSIQFLIKPQLKLCTTGGYSRITVVAGTVHTSFVTGSLNFAIVVYVFRRDG